MGEFNYEKAWCVQAKPAFLAMNDKQKEAHKTIAGLVGELNQGRDLNIPISDEVRAAFDGLSCLEIAEMSRASYFVGHWKPGLCAPVLPNSKGESWKVTNVCDQVLRERLGPYPELPHNILIHEGVFRVTFSSKDCWMWEEFGLATEKNLEIFKTCGLPFGMDTIEKSAKRLVDLCGDMWGNVDDLPSNYDYDVLLIAKKQKGEAIAVAYKMENAALIAAAPEILSALKEAEAYFRELENTKNMIGPEYGIWHRIQARIELAEGRL